MFVFPSTRSNHNLIKTLCDACMFVSNLLPDEPTANVTRVHLLRLKIQSPKRSHGDFSAAAFESFNEEFNFNIAKNATVKKRAWWAEAGRKRATSEKETEFN